MIRALQDDRRKVGTVLAIPLADGRLLGVAVRSDGTVRLFPPDRPPVDLPSAGAALLGQILNRPEGGDS